MTPGRGLSSRSLGLPEVSIFTVSRTGRGQQSLTVRKKKRRKMGNKKERKIMFVYTKFKIEKEAQVFVCYSLSLPAFPIVTQSDNSLSLKPLFKLTL